MNEEDNKRLGRLIFALACGNISVLDEIYQMLAKLLYAVGNIYYSQRADIEDSKGLPQFFVSDIMEEDVACPFGLEDKKLLLFDDFVCWDEGVSMGKVSKDVIRQMPKAN